MKGQEPQFLTIDNWKEDDIFREWPKVIGIIDRTELDINAWHRNAFSVVSKDDAFLLVDFFLLFWKFRGIFGIFFDFMSNLTKFA
jgi:hypothetical protein